MMVRRVGTGYVAECDDPRCSAEGTTYDELHSNALHAMSDAAEKAWGTRHFLLSFQDESGNILSADGRPGVATAGFPDRTEFFPSLFVGGKDAEKGFRGLVIDVREEFPTNSRAIHLPVFKGTSGQWTTNPVLAAEAIEKIARSLEVGRKVLVRCGSGVERSPALAALYLVRKKSMTPTEAYSRIRKVRPQVIEELDLLPLTYEERTR